MRVTASSRETGGSGAGKSRARWRAGRGGKWVAGVLLAGLLGCAPASVHYLTLHDAVEQGDWGGANQLLKQGADVNRRDADGWTALMLASFRGDTALARLLIDRGAEVDAANEEGATSLMIALYSGHRDTALYLLGQGADPNVQTDYGRTPLMIAVHKGDLKCIRELMERGADVQARDPRGGTALTELAWLERTTGQPRPQIQECLARHGAVRPEGRAGEGRGDHVAKEGDCALRF